MQRKDHPKRAIQNQKNNHRVNFSGDSKHSDKNKLFSFFALIKCKKYKINIKLE